MRAAHHLHAATSTPRGRHLINDAGESADERGTVDDGDGSAWAIPYTDLTMLLLVFFVIMLSQAGPPATPARDQQDIVEWSARDLRREPGSEVNPVPSDSGTAGVLPGGKSIVERRADPQAELAAEWTRRVGDLEASAAAFLDRERLRSAIELVRTEAGVELRMPDDVLFPVGTATIQPRGAVLIERLAPLLRQIDGVIEVSGHTDNVPIRTARFPSNWELSAARAIAVVRLLRESGIPETKMQAVGHGANRPVASNDDPAGRTRNRRVTIDIAPRLPGD